MTSHDLYQECIARRLVFWVTDPGHGWLAVPLSEIDRTSIHDRISPYSYIGSDLWGYDGYALLEEDCDAALYIDALALPGNAFVAAGNFCFSQPGCRDNVAHNVRALDSYATRRR